jgi:hypothetical protein
MEWIVYSLLLQPFFYLWSQWRNEGVALPLSSVYVMLTTLLHYSKSYLYNTKHSLYIRAHEREREKIEKRDRTYIYALQEWLIVPNGFIVSLYRTSLINYYILQGCVRDSNRCTPLRNTTKHDIPSKRRGTEKNPKKRKREYVNQKGCPAIIGTNMNWITPNGVIRISHSI